MSKEIEEELPVYVEPDEDEKNKPLAKAEPKKYS